MGTDFSNAIPIEEFLLVLFRARVLSAFKCLDTVSTLVSPHYYLLTNGRPVYQAISSRLFTAAAPVRARFKTCRICGGHSGTAAGFLRVLRFPLPLIDPLIAQLSSPFIPGWCNRAINGSGNSGLGCTPAP
jgi:hypothetical protein